MTYQEEKKEYEKYDVFINSPNKFYLPWKVELLIPKCSA